ncbi:MAG: hypothetical protein R3C02_14045 [Planctomycetaceae bacterium]
MIHRGGDETRKTLGDGFLKSQSSSNMAEQYRSLDVAGFDPECPPEIRHMDDGSLWLVIDPMPPSWLENEDYLRQDPLSLGPCADFDQQLARAICVPVHWDDREFFLIKNPQKDTVNAITDFLYEFRQEHDPTLRRSG